MALAQAFLNLRRNDLLRPIFIPATVELPTDNTLQLLEQTLGVERIRRLEAANFWIVEDNDARWRRRQQREHEQLGIAMLQLFIRTCSGRLRIHVECAQPAPPLMAFILAQRSHLDIIYYLEGDKPTSFRASSLQPEAITLKGSNSIPAIQFGINIRPFFDAPSHVYTQIVAFGLSSACQLPVLRVRRLDIHSGSFTLRPGSTVHECTVLSLSGTSDVGGIDMTGSSCFCISVPHVDSQHGWNCLHNVSASTRCTKLKLMTTEWQTLMTLPDHPILQHVRLLELIPELDRQEIPHNHIELLDQLLVKFPQLTYAWYSRSTLQQHLPVERLLAYKAICQHRQELTDYRTMLPDESLQPVMLGLFAAHLAMLIVGQGIVIPSAVSRHLLQAVLLVN
eukprot:TRINITY_DN10285_c0_g1_i1.p1 TRINITY_DN10285_c0_g1~~TRINITY_DN10285_c0_g1_i1.p1  ORF type:complete len:394 (+),score=59.40 TRINITY_DN10285_c0_g1_i1:2867-4048(+)